ncbi:transmembrane domain-containing protein, partial [Eschrichtius robustus]|nr:transmembrane domain-containing protein [Eschrichtius robustus]
MGPQELRDKAQRPELWFEAGGLGRLGARGRFLMGLSLSCLCFQLVAAIVFVSFGVVAAFCCAIVDGVFAARHIEPRPLTAGRCQFYSSGVGYLHDVYQTEVTCHSLNGRCQLKVKSNTCYCCDLYDCQSAEHPPTYYEFVGVRGCQDVLHLYRLLWASAALNVLGLFLGIVTAAVLGAFKDMVSSARCALGRVTETVATGHISQPHLEPPEITDMFLGGFLTPDEARDTTGDPGDPPRHSHSGWCRRQAQLLLGRKVSFRAHTTSILSFKDESCLPPGRLGSAGPTVRSVPLSQLAYGPSTAPQVLYNPAQQILAYTGFCPVPPAAPTCSSYPLPLQPPGGFPASPGSDLSLSEGVQPPSQPGSSCRPPPNAPPIFALTHFLPGEKPPPYAP